MTQSQAAQQLQTRARFICQQPTALYTVVTSQPYPTTQKIPPVRQQSEQGVSSPPTTPQRDAHENTQTKQKKQPNMIQSSVHDTCELRTPYVYISLLNRPVVSGGPSRVRGSIPCQGSIPSQEVRPISGGSSRLPLRFTPSFDVSSRAVLGFSRPSRSSPASIGVFAYSRSLALLVLLLPRNKTPKRKLSRCTYQERQVKPPHFGRLERLCGCHQPRTPSPVRYDYCDISELEPK